MKTTNEQNSGVLTCKTAAAGLVGGSVLAGVLGMFAPSAHATYATPWSRQDAYNLGITGLSEKYDSSGTHSVWSDDNTWNEAGADCSGYANKVWAVTHQRAIGFDDHGAGSTLTWNNGAVDGSVEIAINDSRPLQMDVWEHRRSDSTGHMGVFEGTRDANGNYKIWNAKGTPYGIVSDYKPLTYFQQSTDPNTGVVTFASKRFKRVNW